MVVSRKGLCDRHEASCGSHERVEGRVATIARDGVVHGFPEAFDGVGPGMIGRLEQQTDPRVMR